MLTFICKQHNRYPFCTCPHVCTQKLTQTHTAHYRGTEVYVSAVFHLPRSNHCHRLVCLILCKFEMGSVVDQKTSFSLLYLHVNSTIKFNFTQIYSVIHTVKGFGIVNKAEIDVFLELSCFLDDPVNVGNLLSGSSAFSKSSLNIWKFTVHVLLKPGLENFEHYFTSMCDE